MADPKLSATTVRKGRFPRLTNKLNERDFKLVKVYCWLGLLQQKLRPIQWADPNSDGCVVKADPLKPEQFEEAIGEFQRYLDELTEEYGWQFHFFKRRPSNEVQDSQV